MPEDYLLTRFDSPVPFDRRTTARSTSRRLVVPPISQTDGTARVAISDLLTDQRGNGAGVPRFDASLANVVRDCLHRPSGLFGVWPLAVRTLTDAGLIAAVECLTDLDCAVPIIERGLPIVASIRFAAGDVTRRAARLRPKATWSS